MAYEFVIVTTTFEQKSNAEKMAEMAVEKQLVACAHITANIRSIYRWQGKVCKADEWECVFKTTFQNLVELKKFIKSTHPYEVPQIIVTPIIDGSLEYLEWIKENSRFTDKTG